MDIAERELALNELIAVFDGLFRTDRGGRDCRECDGFVLILSGAARYDFADSSLTAGAGDVLYLAERASYRITVTDRPYRWICCDFRFRRAAGETTRSALFHPGGGKVMENIFSKLLQLWRMGDFSEKLECKALFYQIYAALIRAAATESMAGEQTLLLQEAVAHIHSNYHDPTLSVEALAGICRTSTVHFRRIFARLYRTSPMKYITALRLSKARELLQSTELPVKAICTQCGYSSVHYFDRVFKKEFGLQPLQFRHRSGI